MHAFVFLIRFYCIWRCSGQRKKSIWLKQIIECIYSSTVVEAFIRSREQSAPTEKGKNALSAISAKVATYKDLTEKYFNSADDVKVIAETFKALKADRENSASLAYHSSVIEKCNELDTKLATMNTAEAIISKELGVNIDGDNITVGPKATKSLGQNELRMVNLTLAARKSPWSSFKSFFEYKKKDSGFSDRPSYYPHTMYYDPKSLVKKDSLRKILTYDSGSDMEVGPLLGEKTKYSGLMVYELNCKEETYRTFGTVNILHPIQKEKVLSTVPDDGGWAYFERDTEVAKLYQMFCE
jgi:hypothetical protein